MYSTLPVTYIPINYDFSSTDKVEIGYTIVPAWGPRGVYEEQPHRSLYFFSSIAL